MSDTKPVNGQNGMLYRWTVEEADPAWKPIGCFTSNEYSADTAINEQSSTKCNPNESRKTEGTKNFSLSGDAEVYDSVDGDPKESYRDLHAIMLAGGVQDYQYNTNTDDVDSLKVFVKGFLTSLVLSQENEQFSTFTLSIDVDGTPLTVDPFV